MRPSSLPWRLLSTIFVSTLTSTVLALDDNSINVSLKTSFGAAPYLVELLETAALENATAYFPLLDRIAEGTFADLQTEKDLYEKFLEILHQDGHFQSHDSLSSFKFALALHAAAPRIEAQFQYYKTAVEPRMMAAQDAACPVWVHLDGQQYCSPALERAQQPVSMEECDWDLPFDHVLGSASDGLPSILYADITHPLFGQFHQTVSQTARDGATSYRVRYRPSNEVTEKSLYIGGYGVELVLKRTDYIVIDDRDANTLKEKDELKDVDDTRADIKPLTTSELANLGINAASHIMSSSSPIDELIEISANFPKYSSTLASKNASADFLKEHMANREMLLPPGYSILWMNGLHIEHRQINAYSLLDTMRKERQVIGRLQEIGLTSTEAIQLLSHEALTQAQVGEEPQRYDWRDDTESKSVIMWLNDIEQDKRYLSWPTGLRMLLQRTYPGQLPQVRRDVHNLIVPVDLADIKDLDMIVNALQQIVKRSIPVRIGLVPVSHSATSNDITKLAYHLLDTYGLSALMKFFEGIVIAKKGVLAAETAFLTAINDRALRPGRSLQTYIDALDAAGKSDKLKAVSAYRDRLALNESPLPFFINGVLLPRNDNWFELMSQRVYSDFRALQMQVYEGTIPDDIVVPEYLLSTASPRRNALIIPNDLKEIQVLNVGEIVAEFPEAFINLPRLSNDDSVLASDKGHILLTADFNSKSGRKILSEALAFHRERPGIEILMLHNQGSDNVDGILSDLLYTVTKNNPSGFSHEGLQKILTTTSDPTIVNSAESSRFWTAHQALTDRLQLKAGEAGIWLNGRFIGPIIQDFVMADFETLFEFEQTSRIAPVITAINALELDDKFKTPLDFAKATSLVARSLKSDLPEGTSESAPLVRIDKFKEWKGEHTAITLGSNDQATVRFVAVIDPATELVQSWIPILKALSELQGVSVTIYLNPREKLTELPVKRFYRQVISSAPAFHEDGTLVIPQAEFTDVPKDPLFNLGMVVAPSWLVSPKESIYDLDNIKLSSIPANQDVIAVYELENILIEGHSRDVTKGPPPRGVQLLLGTEHAPHFTDTIIMANLGYFQFKANPGFWQIALKPGRSSKIFNIDSAGSKGYAPQAGDESTAVALMSFQGATLYPRLSRKAGMEEQDVLEESILTKSANSYLKKGASFASSALSSLGLGKAKSVNAEINIFSVASGHLYERMLNIMMISVMKHTKHTVKFWFIEQFLSPSFKASLPDLAAHYKFDFEMVTYKWPHWLRGQKEKQREIWGYKILFLDVLFPLNLDKVIFVDADQIVRTDMMELNRVDLHGAPYGFTPMCDSRTEMEGFRFWKQGYWENYLAGKPYHISALYVVDLKKFRELAAGDRLRQQYHALSSDPNSLSNLDQDLPNHMQHVLPIHSLNQEWLWCETWCSDESLQNARTIDLCNNPLTKEPKLDRARRQVPEWTVYDEEIAEVFRQVQQKNVSGSLHEQSGSKDEL